MKQSDIFRENAENCLKLAEGRSDHPSRKRFRRMAEGWLALAQEQDWLDGRTPAVPSASLMSPQTVRTNRSRVGG